VRIRDCVDWVPDRFGERVSSVGERGCEIVGAEAREPIVRARVESDFVACRET
jgi:hypothetical protein